MNRIACSLLLLVAAPVFADETPASNTQARYAAAAKYSAAHGGLSLLIHHDGKPVLEEYAAGQTHASSHLLYSGTKSFFGVGVACMIQDGLIKSLDELACETLTEWKGDARRAAITIRHLLDLTSGLDPAAKRELRRTAKDAYARAVELKCTSEPGTTYRYGPEHYYALGMLMKRKLAPKGFADPLDYLKRRLFAPIGLVVDKWQQDGAGNPRTPSGAFLTAREWIKFGELVRAQGTWNGKQVVDKSHLAACFQGSQPNPGYGLTWWLPTQGGLDPRGLPAEPNTAPKDTVMAAGFANQRLYVIPSKTLVVVRQAKNDRSWSDARFLQLLLGGAAPSSADAEAHLSKRAAAEAKAQLAKFDKDGDGAVSEDELPRLLQRFFRFLDTDKSGDLDLKELEAAALRRSKRRARRR